MGREIVIGLHFYQPPREATHPSVLHISTDPEKKNWTAIIEDQCYKPLAQEGLLNKVSFDIYQSLLLQMEKIDSDTALIYQKAMKENGVGEAFIHPILPDLTRDDKSIVISAGVKRFKQLTGENPHVFWPPETAIDTETLEVLSENEYQGFICAPEQIVQPDGSCSDNKPTKINLPNGRSIAALPFDRSVSNKLAFDPKQNADNFVKSYIKPIYDNTSKDQVIIAWTDAETFGHHFKNADKFLKYLINSSLPNIGLYPISINKLLNDNKKLSTGKIVERSAWSCPHGNLIRWNGSCECGWGQDTSWKKPFMESMDYLNNEVTKILLNCLGTKYVELVSDYFYTNFSNSETHDYSLNALKSAKIASLVAKTSCATFFSNPEVSGKINLLYAYESILYLKNAGVLVQSEIIENELFKKLDSIQYPGGKNTALSNLKQMLES